MAIIDNLIEQRDKKVAELGQVVASAQFYINEYQTKTTALQEEIDTLNETIERLEPHAEPPTEPTEPTEPPTAPEEN